MCTYSNWVWSSRDVHGSGEIRLPPSLPPNSPRTSGRDTLILGRLEKLHHLLRKSVTFFQSVHSVSFTDVHPSVCLCLLSHFLPCVHSTLPPSFASSQSGHVVWGKRQNTSKTFPLSCRLQSAHILLPAEKNTWQPLNVHSWEKTHIIKRFQITTIFLFLPSCNYD